MPEQSGPDRIRAAIAADRGGNAPNMPIQVCGPKCRGQYDAPPSDPIEAHPARLMRNLADALICPGCLRLRFSPVHLVYRLVGICDGRNCA
jgi:hypothetical protein